MDNTNTQPTNLPQQSNPLPNVPVQWPRAFGVYKYSKAAILRSLSTIILLALVTFACDFGVNFVGTQAKPYALLVNLAGVLIGIYLGLCQLYTIIKSARGERIELGVALKQPAALFAKLIGLNILVGLTVFGGLILLIVPGIIFGLRLSLAQYFLVDQNLGVVEAYTASWHATKGNLGKLWGIIGVQILMTLPVITIIGALLSIYWLFLYAAANAVLYLYLTQGAQPSQQQAAAPVKQPA